jgi:hypothetical protein
MFDSPSPLPSPSSVLTDVVSLSFRRSRSDSRLVSIRDHPWLSLWVSEGSRREFGWLARIVSTLDSRLFCSHVLYVVERVWRAAMCGPVAIRLVWNDALTVHFRRGSSLRFLWVCGAGEWFYLLMGMLYTWILFDCRGTDTYQFLISPLPSMALVAPHAWWKTTYRM